MKAAQLTEVFPYYSHSMPSAATFAIAAADLFMSVAQSYPAELPAAVLAIVRAETSGAVGLSYRRYARTMLAPGLRRPGGGHSEGPRSDHQGERCPHTPRPAKRPTAALAGPSPPRPPASPHTVAIERLTGGKFSGRRLEDRSGRFLRTPVVRIRGLMGGHASAWEDEVFTGMWPGAPLPFAGLMECLG